MHTYFQASGSLNKGFVGQISYTVCLDKEYKGMNIEFSFNKQRFTAVTEELKSEFLNTYGGEYGISNYSDEELNNAIREMKTEIHTLVTMNEEFIGGVHKQLTTRQMTFTPDFTSDGCIPQTGIAGVLKITLVVFNVIMDHTDYQLTLTVES